MKWSYLLLLALLTIANPACGQFDDQRSTYKYYYQLNTHDVKELLNGDKPKLESHHLHSLVDSISVDSIWQVTDYGSFLEVSFVQNEMKANLLSNVPFEVSIIDNQTDLAIKVTDDKLQNISSAQININKRRIPYDKKCQCYRLKKSNKNGILTVKVDEEILILPLERNYNQSRFKQFKNKLAYGTPLKYAVLPIRYVINLPIDGYRSIKRGYSTGAIRGTANWFEKLYRKAACVFDDYYCEDYDNNKVDGYMVFSQPKYRLGDTLKAKAFLVKNKKRAWNKPVIVELIQGYSKALYVDTVSLDQPGVFNYKLHLVESLGLNLDQTYMIRISDLKDRTMMQSSFILEDYELSGIELKVTGHQSIQYRGLPHELTLLGMDENGLPLFDARYEVLGLTRNIVNCQDSVSIIADTLFNMKYDFDEKGVKVVVPDSIFQTCQLDYNLIVKMRTADNDIVEESFDVKYFFNDRKINHALLDSAIVFHYEENGSRVIDEPMSLSFYRDNQLVESSEIYMPYKYDSRAFIDKLVFNGRSDFQEVINISDIDANVSVSGSRTIDSLHVVATNPLNLILSYFLYRNNKEVKAGASKNIEFHLEDRTKSTYILMVSYTWGGETINKAYTLGFDRNKLIVNIEAPTNIFPGQIDTLEVDVKDVFGKPVSGIDLTVFGMTDKFDYELPEMPSTSGIKQRKKYYNQFNLDDRAESFTQEVDYWQRKAFSELKDKHYYDLILPGNRLYQKSIVALDSITQFSPFVVHRGKLKYCNIIYVDGRPVYFGWNSISASYTFEISPGKHTITLRTDDAEIEIKDVEFELGKKTYISVDQAFSGSGITIKPMPAEFTQREKNIIYPYLFLYNPLDTKDITTLYSGGKYFLLGRDKERYWLNHFSGPVSDREIVINNYDSDYYLRDLHEPKYVYTYKKDYLKLKEATNYAYPELNKKEVPWDFDAQILTASRIDSIVSSRRQENKALQYSYSRKRTFKGKGRIQLSNDLDMAIQNIVLLSNWDYNDVRLVRGKELIIHDLEPGAYSIVIISNDQEILETDEVEVSPDGATVINISTLNRSLSADRYQVLDDILERFLENRFPLRKELENEEIRRIRLDFKKPTLSGFGNTISGFVFDEGTGEPLIGATVLVVGTNNGVATDIDGSYEIDLEFEPGTALEFSYIGFTTKIMEVGGGGHLDVSLPEGLDLDEVVVTGLGVRKSRKALGYGVSIIESNNLSRALQGRAAGVSISEASGLSGASHNIMIRGYSSVGPAEEPLYIVNGVPSHGDLSKLNPDYIQSIKVIKGSEATTLYGSSAKHGVIIISTSEKIELLGFTPITISNEIDLVGQSTEFSIRSNFRDAAFWQPSLTTDKNGKASFVVQFPDDVTKWKAYAIAMDKKLRSGTTTEEIRAFKPLLAELKLPRFMTAGDRVWGIGSITNYSGDSLVVSTTFKEGDKEWQGAVSLTDNNIDTLMLNAPSSQDSITYEYTVRKPDGYMDGERRKVMIQPIGIERPVGQFLYLDESVDTIITMDLIDSLGAAQLWIDDSNKGSLLAHLEYLENYKYGCNEQLASRLIGHLVREKICKTSGLNCGASGKIKKLIRQLLENHNVNGMWSWFGKNDHSAAWVSNHVIKALILAKEFGYDVKLDTKYFLRGAQMNFKYDTSNISRSNIVESLIVIGDTTAARDLYSRMELTVNSTYRDSIQFAFLAAIIGNPKSTLIEPYLKKDGLGDLYIAPASRYQWSGYRDVSYINGYVAIKNDPRFESKDVKGMKNKFNKTSQRRGFNTYTSALWLYHNWTDLLDQIDFKKSIKLNIDEEIIEVNSFPFKRYVTHSFSIEKPKGIDLYLSTSQTYRDTISNAQEGFFKVQSRLQQYDETVTGLKAGDNAKLVININVEGDASQVLLRIPIPASCSYTAKPQNFRHAVHAEYFREEVAIYYDDLPAGIHKIEIPLIAKFAGDYHINPTHVFMMYNPDNQGNTGLKKVRVE